MSIAGAAAGRFGTHAALSDGAAQAVSPRLGDLRVSLPAAAPTCRTPRDAPLLEFFTPFWHVGGTKRAWLDFQNDCDREGR